MVIESIFAAVCGAKYLKATFVTRLAFDDVVEDFQNLIQRYVVLGYVLFR